MPCISYFYGIQIYLYPNDHDPPHFHVRYGEFKARINIETGAITKGKLPNKARLLTEEWRLIHQAELLKSFEYMVKFHKLIKIKGLE
jgi:hypothetical protein